MEIATFPKTLLPFLGTVKAGFPTFVEEENDLISLEDYLTDNVHASFMIKIKNDNLSNIGILKGDLAVIERRNQVNQGEIVLVLIDGHHLFLKSEMNQGKIILRSFVDDSLQTDVLQIIGVIKGVIRKY